MPNFEKGRLEQLTAASENLLLRIHCICSVANATLPIMISPKGKASCLTTQLAYNLENNRFNPSVIVGCTNTRSRKTV